jgi:hypothetical protein
MTTLTFLFNKSNPYGISKDIEGMAAAITTHLPTHKQRYADPLEIPFKSDIIVHVEIPVYGWMPWASRNVLVVNPEWFQEAWIPYMSRFDAVIYKNRFDLREAVNKGYVEASKATLVSWGCDKPTPVRPLPKGTADTGFVWFLGGSVSKRAYVPTLVAKWRPSYPPLRIYSVAPVDVSGLEIPETVRFEVEDLDTSTRTSLSQFFRGHIGCSRAEGFSYPAAEAEWAGAYTVLNNLNCFQAD